MEGVLYHGQRLPKRVIIEKIQQREIMKNFHIEEGTGNTTNHFLKASAISIILHLRLLCFVALLPAMKRR